ncbi:MAG: ABC-type multidrug transport system fused ATPase/permease subunit [Cognaticolwellia sp.]|jgi:ABC-type multidrug transport system fused ATPase/permease subunit
MKNESFWKILQYVNRYRGYAFFSILFNLLSAALATFVFILLDPFLKVLFGISEVSDVEPVFYYSIDYVFDYLNYTLSQYIQLSGKESALIWVCKLIAIIFLFKNIFRYLAIVLMGPVRKGVVTDIRSNIFDKLLALPLSFFSDERKGDLLGRVTVDVVEVESSILKIIETIIKEPFVVIISLVTVFSINTKLALFTLGPVLVIVLLVGMIGRTLKKKSLAVQNKLGDTLSIIDEAISGLRIIQAFNAEKYQSKKFREEHNTWKRLSIRLILRNGLASPLTEFLLITVLATLLWYGGYLVFSGELEASKFFVFIGMFYNIVAPTKSLSSAFYSVQKGMGAVERIDKILNAEISIKEKVDAKSISNFNQSIHYKDITFTYDGQFEVLKKVNLEIPKGNIVALVGLSGAGKTTMADLLPRFYDATSGQILIDNIDIRDYKLKELRGLMGIVSQQPILFNDTIFNNIAFGLEHVSEAEVIEAAKVANAHDFIVQTENGYQTIIGDSGGKLSGGQRQRLTIARAVLQNPAILILDEATSSLDSESEKLVQDALFKLMQNRTSIVIAHRLSTIQHADIIVVMQDGEILEKGTHHELLKHNGVYQKLVNLQSF